MFPKPGFSLFRLPAATRSRLAPLLLASLLLGGCAAYSGRGLQAGASVDEVIGVMGEPAMRWRDPDGSQQFSYPRGPAGVHSFMAFFAPDGRLQRLDNVLTTPYFARLVPGKTDREGVLRLFGPPVPQWTAYFKARDELVWEYRFCDDWAETARFDVLFDATTGIVRTAYQRSEKTIHGWRTPCAR